MHLKENVSCILTDDWTLLSLLSYNGKCSIEFFHVLQVVLLEYALKTAVILPWCPTQSVAHSCGNGHGYQPAGITNTLYRHGYACLKMPLTGVLTTLRRMWNSFVMFLRCFWCMLLTSCFIPVVGHYFLHFVKNNVGRKEWRFVVSFRHGLARTLHSVDRASLYNLVNKANWVHNFS